MASRSINLYGKTYGRDQCLSDKGSHRESKDEDDDEDASGSQDKVASGDSCKDAGGLTT